MYLFNHTLDAGGGICSIAVAPGECAPIGENHGLILHRCVIHALARNCKGVINLISSPHGYVNRVGAIRRHALVQQSGSLALKRTEVEVVGGQKLVFCAGAVQLPGVRSAAAGIPDE